jgi:hypothetical protein
MPALLIREATAGLAEHRQGEVELAGEPLPVELAGEPLPVELAGEPLPVELAAEPRPVELAAEPRPVEPAAELRRRVGLEMPEGPNAMVAKQRQPVSEMAAQQDRSSEEAEPMDQRPFP